MAKHLKGLIFFKSGRYPFFPILLLLLIPIWNQWLAPRLTKIPDHFTYSANILSLDNFYNEKLNKFEGEHISKTLFSYEVSAVKENYLVIKNSFSVRTLNDKPIFSVVRFYNINPYDRRHVIVPGEKQRSGYLFSPIFVGKDNYDYWHINYDSPAKLIFIKKEKIEDLTVNHYQAHYQADQTANLGYLPGVPKERGIKTDIILQLWIEPISGWLVQYQDNTLAYYYDQKTGKRLAPWNQFSNRYTQNSIRQQVENATQCKTKILIIYFWVPLLIELLAIILIINFYFKMNKIKKLILFMRNYLYHFSVFIIILMIILVSIYFIFSLNTKKAVFVVGIAQWANYPDLTEAVKGFKAGLQKYGFQEGKNIKFISKNANENIENQIVIIQSFIKNRVDLIFSLTTPGTLVAKGIAQRIPVVFSDVMYPVESEIITSLKKSHNNFVGSRNYILPEIQFYDFNKLFPNIKNIGFVHHKGDADSEIFYQEYKDILSKRNIEVIDISAVDLDDLRNQLNKKYDALFLACDTLIQNGGSEIVLEKANREKIPTFSCSKDSVLKGALIGYIADLYTIGEMAGRKAALILSGAEIGWLDTESPDRGYLIINDATARLLGITIPPDMLKRTNDILHR